MRGSVRRDGPRTVALLEAATGTWQRFALSLHRRNSNPRRCAVTGEPITEAYAWRDARGTWVGEGGLRHLEGDRRADP